MYFETSKVFSSITLEPSKGVEKNIDRVTSNQGLTDIADLGWILNVLDVGGKYSQTQRFF